MIDTTKKITNGTRTKSVSQWKVCVCVCVCVREREREGEGEGEMIKMGRERSCERKLKKR